MYTRGLGQDYGPTLAQLNASPSDVLASLPLVGPYTVGSTAPSEAQTQAALSLALSPPSSSTSISQWLSANSTYLIIGGAAVLAFLMLLPGRRR